MALTVKQLTEALDGMIAAQEADRQTITDLAGHVASLTHAMAAIMSATPKAEAAAPTTTSKPKATTAAKPESRCVMVKANGKRCRQTDVDSHGLCKYHASAKPTAATPKAEAAKPEAAAPTLGGPYSFAAGVTCKGVKGNGDPCSGHFVNAKGYCKHHHTQVTGRSRKAK
jgi:hypothetical protein